MSHITLMHVDRMEMLKGLKRKPKLIVTSPNYNIGKVYEKRKPLDEYISDQRETIKKCAEILCHTGSICWQVGNYIEGTGKTKEAFPLDLVLYPIFKSCGLKLKNRVVWHFGHGLHDKYRLSGRHETILWFSKSQDYTFNLDPIRVPQKYPSKRHFKGKKKGELSGNPLGKNPSDVWDIPNVKNNHVEKVDHPCQFPVGLVGRLVKALTNEGDLVVDPYMGVGTTAVACMMNGRDFVGSDIVKRYVDIAEERVRKAGNGTLRVRDCSSPSLPKGGV